MRRNFVTKCALSSHSAQKFCYEMRVVTKCAEILLRNACCYKMLRKFVTKCAHCYIMCSGYEMRLNMPSTATTSWFNWSKRTIKFLFYLLLWSLIIHAGRVMLYFIAIYTSIWSCTRVNIIRKILEVLPRRFSTSMKMFSSYNNTRYYTLKFEYQF